MATSGAYITSSKAQMGRAIPYSTVTRKEKKALMKISLKQRFRNWLLDNNAENEAMSQDIVIQDDKLASDGMRLQIYKATGGFVIETRSYDRQRDRHLNSMHVITEDQDLGDALGKIVMMEALRG
jgi:hypothetical protein